MVTQKYIFTNLPYFCVQFMRNRRCVNYENYFLIIMNIYYYYKHFVRIKLMQLIVC